MSSEMKKYIKIYKNSKNDTKQYNNDKISYRIIRAFMLI